MITPHDREERSELDHAPGITSPLDDGSDVTFPGTRAPDRTDAVDAGGVRIAVHEWGDADAPPLVLAHGGFDFARTFDAFAPLLADAGWRVVSWDQRGHGDSAHVELYSWDADLRDAAAVFDHVAGRAPVHVIGHSKGGAMMIQLADAEPFRFSALVNIDGMPSKHPVPDVAEHDRTRMLASEVTGWLDHRGRTAEAQRRPGTIDELATRRGRMNPRLSHEWLRYLVTVGASRDDAGWRWKLDPSMRFGGFGPWRPQWSLFRLAGIGVPFYGMLVGIEEEMGWKTLPHELEPFLPSGARLEVLDDVGHFAHIERPTELAEGVLDFLGRPPSGRLAPKPANRSEPHAERDGPDPADDGRFDPEPDADRSVVWLRHNRARLALHRLHDHPDGTPLLWLHGLGERSPAAVPAELGAWDGPIFALDFTGHGASTLPVGGGYTAEVLMADADAALGHLGEATIVGRGLGGYIALLLAGGRPTRVRGAVIADGPGLSGGPSVPTSQAVISAPLVDTTPDPDALIELGRDLRPPDYATTFSRAAVELSGLDEPITVVARFRPAWVAAVVEQPGVATAPTIGAALRSRGV